MDAVVRDWIFLVIETNCVSASFRFRHMIIQLRREGYVNMFCLKKYVLDFCSYSNQCFALDKNGH
jgi:hypothetical protein